MWRRLWTMVCLIKWICVNVCMPGVSVWDGNNPFCFFEGYVFIGSKCATPSLFQWFKFMSMRVILTAIRSSENVNTYWVFYVGVSVRLLSLSNRRRERSLLHGNKPRTSRGAEILLSKDIIVTSLGCLWMASLWRIRQNLSQWRDVHEEGVHGR